ncbi:hypothetical protein FCIRC_13734 [Fusarium circinatum]|uniref:Protein kinase domain-containing protein n=1 Tax=Fusarium circinatum TaxID=48490 RepID=A0A8H5SSM7_FUSCI|nr:hypothetical protein FCIRC_13734 [Fusarium circinatum]
MKDQVIVTSGAWQLSSVASLSAIKVTASCSRDLTMETSLSIWATELSESTSDLTGCIRVTFYRAKIVGVSFGGVDPFSVESVVAYEKALEEAKQQGTRVRWGYMLCQSGKNPEAPSGPEFTSALNINPDGLIDRDLLHVLWGMGKDFGSCGIRIGSLISRNEALLRACEANSYFSGPSSLTYPTHPISPNQKWATCGIGDGANIVLGFNGCLLSVSIFPSNGSSTKDTEGQQDGPQQDHFIDALEKATVCQDDDEYEELVDEVLIPILDTGRPLFRQLIPSRDERVQDNQSLYHLLFPPVLYFRLEAPTPTTSVSLISIDSSEASTTLTIDPAFDHSIDQDLQLNPDIPRFTPEDISVAEVFVRGAFTITAAVEVQGQDMFCKSHVRAGGLFGTSEARELNCLNEMVKHILGFLRQWVSGRRLSDAIAAATAEKRQKWACQIRQSIELLHQNGLVWGDGKASNIIIDDKDDAWLVDFGGGYTRGWVDEELAETQQGDEQALEKIIEFLSGNEDVPLSP